MAIDKLLDNCQTLEKTISILIKTNSTKQLELNRLQNLIFDESRASLDMILAKENDLQQRLDAMKLEKTDLDTAIKQYSEINEKLTDLVNIVQKSVQTDEHESVCKDGEIQFIIADALDEYSQLKQECAKVQNKVARLLDSLDKDRMDIKNFILEKQNIVIDLHRNDANIRLFEQQNKFAEQQFDLIINQIPWEPLPEQYIDDLKKSHVQSIRDMADTLKLQKNEIDDLTDSLNTKKTRKLQVLEELYTELASFIQKRDEAVLITRALDG